MDQSGTPRVGARCSTTRRIGFADRPTTSELVHIDPPKTWGVRGVDGPIRAKVDVRVDALTDTRSRLAITVDFEGRGIGKVLVPLVVRREARKGDAGQPRDAEATPRNRISQCTRSRNESQH
jgi:GNAT superfamily N-acetyltransferase